MMKITFLLLFMLAFALVHPSFAQPFELDPKIKPIKLQLKEDTKEKGVKGVATVAIIDKEDAYYYVKGHDMFELIDVYILSYSKDAEFSADLVKNNWKESIEKQTSTLRENGIINFKLRTWGDFGFRINSSEKKFLSMIIVTATPHEKDYLGSPFVEATEDATKKKIDKKEETSRISNQNYFNYVKTKLVKENVASDTNTNDCASLSLESGEYREPIWVNSSFYAKANLLGDFTNSETIRQDQRFWTLEDARRGKLLEDVESIFDEFIETLETDEDKELVDADSEIRKTSESRKERLSGILSNIGALAEAASNYSDYKSSYQGLTSCMNVGPVPGAPKIPSFCTTEECGACFSGARRKFNFTRYQFEKLSAIYNCTINFSNKAIAFGDNASGGHAVSGLAWQTQKRKIEKSVDGLKTAFDRRYGLLVNDLQDSMQKLDRCEAANGMPDWYDRYGFMYMEFMKLRYQRDK